MADFKILAPIVPFSSVLGSNIAADATYGVLNSRGGSLSETVLSDTATTEFGITYTLTANAVVNYLVVSNLRGLIEKDGASIGVRLYYNDTSTFYSYTASLAGLIGPRSADFLTAVTSTSEDYYQARTITSNSIVHEFSKIFMGEAFEFSREPMVIDIKENRLDTGDKRAARRFSLTWEGLTPAEKTSFVETIVPLATHTPIYLWDSEDRCFFGDELVYARLNSFRCKINEREVWSIETDWSESI